MDKKESKKRICGPRVKTGCITCRIRRVKCDEGKPACERCTSTGRKCDGYVQPQQKAVEKTFLALRHSTISAWTHKPLSMIMAMPSSIPGTERERQFFHFYCVQSAFDLSVYLNSAFWYNMILQYSHKYPVVRQAVVAFGASHTYAININAKSGAHQALEHDYEQAKQYDKALRWLRAYMDTGEHPDPQVILICCALFCSSENGRGNRTAALQHLERGLSIINAEHRKKLLSPVEEERLDSHVISKISCENPNACVDRFASSEVDEELLYVFSRLDCQATLCQETREPVLDLDDLTQADNTYYATKNPFRTINDAQRGLDMLHNRLAKFLTRSARYSQDSAKTLPPSVIKQKKAIHIQCVNWEELMNGFVAAQSPMVQRILLQKHMAHPREDPDGQLALQVQLLVLHHRCWWMLFRSSYPHNPTVFTMSPNPRAEEILDVCEFLGFSLPIRPSASSQMNDADMAWKLISEIGVAAPLFVLATKCTDASVQVRARRQLEALRAHRNGIYDKVFLTRVIRSIEQQQNEGTTEPEFEVRLEEEGVGATQGPMSSESFCHSPYSASNSGSSQISPTATDDSLFAEETRELLGWGRKSSAI